MAETPKTAANKSSAMRWASGLVVLLALGVIAWLLSSPRGEAIDPTPQHQPGYDDGGSDLDQPPAVIPNQDPTGSPSPAPPAGGGAGTQ